MSALLRTPIALLYAVSGANGQSMLRDLKKQMEQYIVLFEHKKYFTRPLLIPEDGPIAKYRRNARRFYSGEFYRLENE